MTERQSAVQSLLRRLEEERDELKVKVGLAKLEAREEWNELEGKIDRLRGQIKRLRDEADDSSENVGEALELLGEEIGRGLSRIRKLF